MPAKYQPEKMSLDELLAHQRQPGEESDVELPLPRGSLFDRLRSVVRHHSGDDSYKEKDKTEALLQAIGDSVNGSSKQAEHRKKLAEESVREQENREQLQSAVYEFLSTFAEELRKTESVTQVDLRKRGGGFDISWHKPTPIHDALVDAQHSIYYYFPDNPGEVRITCFPKRGFGKDKWSHWGKNTLIRREETVKIKNNDMSPVIRVTLDMVKKEQTTTK